MEARYQSIVEYAREKGISDMTVRRRIKTGKLPAVLKDGKYFIRLQELQSSLSNSSLNYSSSKILDSNLRTSDYFVASELTTSNLMKNENSKNFEDEIFSKKMDDLDYKLTKLQSQLRDKSTRLEHLERKFEDLKMLVDMLEDS